MNFPTACGVRNNSSLEFKFLLLYLMGSGVSDPSVPVGETEGQSIGLEERVTSLVAYIDNARVVSPDQRVDRQLIQRAISESMRALLRFGEEQGGGEGLGSIIRWNERERRWIKSFFEMICTNGISGALLTSRHNIPLVSGEGELSGVAISHICGWSRDVTLYRLGETGSVTEVWQCTSRDSGLITVGSKFPPIIPWMVVFLDDQGVTELAYSASGLSNGGTWETIGPALCRGSDFAGEGTGTV